MPELNYLIVLALSSLYVVGLVIYRLILHPLASFPGPKLAAATGWYEAYFELIKKPGGMFMHEVERMHSIYGPIVRINPHELRVKDPSWVEVIYVNPTKGARDKWPPAALMAGTPQGCFGTIPHDTHRIRRAAVNRFYSKASVASNESMIYDKVDLFSKSLKSQLDGQGVVEMRTNFFAFTMDVLGEVAFGGSMDLLNNKQLAIEWHTTVKSLARFTPSAKQFSWSLPVALKVPLKLVQFCMPDLSRIIDYHHKMRREASIAVHEHGKSASQAKHLGRVNIFESILRNDSLSASEKSGNRIAQEGFEVMSAGGETTSRVLAAALFYVLAGKNSELSRLKEELSTVVKDGSSRPSWSALEQLPYLTAVIKESLRITAPISSRLPVVAPQENLQYGEWEIPAGTPVGMTLRQILLDETIFPEPLVFRPDRWLKSNPDLELISRYYLPFSRGSRMCMGVNLAYCELYLLLARLFRDFDLELVNTTFERDIKVVRDCFLGFESPESKGIRVQRSSKKQRGQ
ncbi:hypothetical protein MMC10_009894 [Thelotrema lepadinum]|nr:hypothetical protein [Thelotrema lepadinum]